MNDDRTTDQEVGSAPVETDAAERHLKTIRNAQTAISARLRGHVPWFDDPASKQSLPDALRSAQEFFTEMAAGYRRSQATGGDG